MAVSNRVRFDVFKRDGFTCQYCGRKTPDVVLEVDHILARAEGGSDDTDNLATSCYDCNRGKGTGRLDDRAPVLTDLQERTDLLRAREEQLLEYNKALAEVRARIDADFNRAWRHWFDAFRATKLERWEVPWEGALRRSIEQLGIEEVLNAIDITAAKFGGIPASKAPRYFGGVLRRVVARREGRVVPCAVCGYNLVLDHGEDPTATWWCGVCNEKQEKAKTAGG